PYRTISVLLALMVWGTRQILLGEPDPRVRRTGSVARGCARVTTVLFLTLALFVAVRALRGAILYGGSTFTHPSDTTYNLSGLLPTQLTRMAASSSLLVLLFTVTAVSTWAASCLCIDALARRLGELAFRAELRIALCASGV